MDKDTVLYLVSLALISIAIAGFYFGRKKQHVEDTTREAEWKGGINAKLDQVLASTSTIPGMNVQIAQAVELGKSAHKRIDDQTKTITEIKDSLK